MAIKDINLSFENNIYDDISVLLDLEAVKARLYNDIMISSDELPFEDNPKETVSDALHDYTFVAEDNIRDIVTESIKKDDRIDELTNVELTDNAGDVYQRSKVVNLSFVLAKRFNNEPVTITLVIEKT